MSRFDGRFPSGLFVAMSDDQTFHYYSWDDFAGDDLKKAPNGVVRRSESIPHDRADLLGLSR